MNRGPGSTSNPPDRSLLRRALRQGRPHRGQLFVATTLSFLGTPLALLQPVPLKIVVDNFIGSEAPTGWLNALIPGSPGAGATRVLIFAVVLQVTVVFLSGSQQILTSLTLARTGEHILLDFKGRLLEQAQRLSFSYHDRTGTSESIYRIQYDANSIKSLAVDSVVPMVSSIVMFASFLFVIARLSAPLTLVALAITPLLYLYGRQYRRRMRPQYRQLKRLESSALSVIQEVLTSFRVVKAFGQEDRETNRFVRRAEESVEARIRLSVKEGLFELLISTTMAIGTSAVLLIGARSVRSGQLTLGEMLVIISYLSQLYGPLQSISKRIASMQTHLASAQRAFELLDEQPEVADKPEALPLRRARGHVVLQDVCFRYDERTSVIADANLEIPAGTKVGITGSTGAGKTTLVSLLTRFYDPSSGAILLDGTDLRDYKLKDLRSQFAIVLQEPLLFSTSIGENIRYACWWASPQQVSHAATAAGAHDFISKMPDGYETMVGERGMRLSGGERQRISLARAFLKNAPILILDEPTSSVDVETEAQILEAMERLMLGRTSFMIAHRLSTLRSCDLRIHVENGRVRVIESALASPAVGMGG